ncbi:MAG: D-alanyl-D-alanine carboxypeptidase [Sphingobacteriia bacterium]|nr:D-alanyl-D-alanine carboxypeptidase [Sphingobacteriia bacterium]
MKYWLACLASIITLNTALSFETKAPYAILMDYETGSILFDKNANEKIAPSSMSKLMTIYIVFEKLKKGDLQLSDKFTVSANAWSKQGSKMFIQVGSQVSVEDLLKGIIIQSGNDACIALAESIAGSEAEFANLMNIKAKELGLTNSNFVNSTGWPDEGHLMSMFDLAILSKRLITDFPDYYHYFAEKEFTYNNIKQQNRNVLLNRNLGVDGLKTGHTETGGYGIAISSQQKNRRMIAVVNGLNSQTERADEVEKLLNYGFINFANLKLYEKNQVVGNVPIWLGNKKEVPVYIRENVWFSVLKHEIDKVKVLIKHDEKVPSPIAIDQKIAELHVIFPNGKIEKFDLLSKEEVKELSWFSRVIHNLKNKLGIND